MTPAASSVATNRPPEHAGILRGDSALVLPPGIPDPLEPFNRVMWAFNRGVMIGIVQPTSKAYRWVVRKPLRRGIENFGRNITYPGRFINHLLQGRWTGARQETDRFFCNTIAGAAGFVDVATQWHLAKSDADFGQTFGRWGWESGCYLMLPILGPSSERDTLGLAADSAANPLTYITPYSITTENPLTFFSPYTYFSYTVLYNRLSESVDGQVRLIRSEADPYAFVQYAWSFLRSQRKPDLQLSEEPDRDSLETLQAAGISVKDPKFPERGRTRSVLIPTTERKLKFTYWLQPGKAPLVCLVPGLGSHRMTEMVLAMAELAYWGGCSVACVSSPYNYEFIERASTAAMPGYTPVDVADLTVALKEIQQDLDKKYPNRFGSRVLMGYSMGGFETLMICAASAGAPSALHFDRYVAIDVPVRLLHGISKLDEFYNAPLAWPATGRTARLENTFLKIAAKSQGTLTSPSTVPLSGVESKFLIGASFRFILRDAIYASQRRVEQSSLRQPPRARSRRATYREIMQYSYADYFQKLAVPYYSSRGVDLTPDILSRVSDLREFSSVLQTNRQARVVVNENDFLLSRDDLSWLKSTFGPDRLTLFRHGGHLGNLGDVEVQAAILRMLTELETR